MRMMVDLHRNNFEKGKWVREGVMDRWRDGEDPDVEASRLGVMRDF